MNFKELKQKFKDSLIIDTQAISLSNNPNYLRRQISEGKEKKWLIELRRGMYVINDLYFEEKISKLYIANKIYTPSYISLEYALSEYEIIPEKVTTVTSITTRKTAYFKNHYGGFSYTKIKNNCFFGYKLIKHNNQNILYATKEKALIDFLYINLKNIKEDVNAFSEYRFQNLQSFNFEKVTRMTSAFNNLKLNRLIKLLKEYAKEKEYKKL